MKCPSCGYENEASALSCNLCTKLLASSSKPVPPSPAPVAAASPAAVPSASIPAATATTPTSSRVPSWPNCAVLCFLFIPALTIVLSPIFLQSDDSDEERMRGPQGEKFLALLMMSAGSLAASIPIAARLTIAPLAATVLSVLTLIVGLALDSHMSSGLLWVLAGGTGMAWYGRSAFRNPWDPAQIVGWISGGYRRLLAPDPRAFLRLIIGISLFIGGIVGMLVAGMLIAKSIGLPRALAKLLAIPAFLGGFLAASGLSFSEEKAS